MKERIVFFGTDDFVIPVLERLTSHDLVLVISNNPTGGVAKFCEKNNIPYTISNLKDVKTVEKIKALNPTVAILASYGAIIPNSVISLFPNGIINVHPSLLPKYKGPSPVQFAILHGEITTGVTIIKLDSQVDHGPVLAQQKYDMTGNKTAPELLLTLFQIGADLIDELITKLENGQTLEETMQDHSQESWSKMIKKTDGMIDINDPQTTTYKLQNMIRAYHPWPGVWFRTILNGQEKLIKLLPENKIQVEGKNIVTYKDFINGFGEEGKEIIEKLELS